MDVERHNMRCRHAGMAKSPDPVENDRVRCGCDPKPKREWVVGFLYDMAGDRVVLIRKNRPEWQKGRLNGVGGKLEADDDSLESAMVREFREETGVTVISWQHFARLTWEEGVVHFFRSFAAPVIVDSCQTMTDEAIEVHHIHMLLAPGPVRDGVATHAQRVTPNLLWLVPLGAHRWDDYDVIDVVETGTTMRKPGRLQVGAV